MFDGWELSWRTDPRAREVADRHYSRQKIGSKGFVQSASCMVLYHESAQGKAYWVSVRPKAEYVLHRWPTAWQCAAFRNESTILSSDMIRTAVACTRWYYGEPPDIGMITFVAPDKVRHKRDPGRCFLRAGFHYILEDGNRATTADGSKIVLQMAHNDIPCALKPDTTNTPLATLMTALSIRLAPR